MVPIFIGLAVWILICAVIVLVIFLASRRLRPFSGFVFFTPALGIAGACVGFSVVGWFFNERVRLEVAMSLAFYLGFLLCGAIGSALGLVGGFVVWKRLRRQTGLTIESQN
jgi:hypothetical protein